MYPMDGTIETLKTSNALLRAVNAKLLEALERFVKAAPAGRYRPTGNNYGAALTAARAAIEEARKC